MEIPEAFSVNYIDLVSRPGRSIQECMRGAIHLAFSENVRVRFEHNDFVYTVSPEEIFQGVVAKKALGTNTYIDKRS